MHYDIVLIFGQSNAVGARSDPHLLGKHPGDAHILYAYLTYYEGLTLIRPGQTHEGTDAARNSHGWKTLGPVYGHEEGGWAESGGNNDWSWHGENTWGWSVEIPFARRYNEEIGPLAAIKVAIGGTCLAHNKREWSAHPTPGFLYRAARDFTLERLAELKAQGHTYRIVSFIWYQGESDNTEQQPGDRLNQLARLIDTLQDDLGQRFPTVLVRTREREHVREADLALAASRPDVIWVDSDDLELWSDNLHVKGEGLLTLGHRIYDAWKTQFYRPGK